MSEPLFATLPHPIQSCLAQAVFNFSTEFEDAEAQQIGLQKLQESAQNAEYCGFFRTVCGLPGFAEIQRLANNSIVEKQKGSAQKSRLAVIMSFLKRQESKANALSIPESLKLAATIKEYAIELHSTNATKEATALDRAVTLIGNHASSIMVQAIARFGRLSQSLRDCATQSDELLSEATTDVESYLTDIRVSGLADIHTNCPGPVWIMMEDLVQTFDVEAYCFFPHFPSSTLSPPPTLHVSLSISPVLSLSLSHTL